MHTAVQALYETVSWSSRLALAGVFLATAYKWYLFVARYLFVEVDVDSMMAHNIRLALAKGRSQFIRSYGVVFGLRVFENKVIMPLIATQVSEGFYWYKGPMWLYLDRPTDKAKKTPDDAGERYFIRFFRWSNNFKQLCREITLMDDFIEDIVPPEGFELGETSDLEAMTSYQMSAAQKLVYDDLKHFLSMEAFHVAKRIPWCRGYLLHGLPGGGKSAFIKFLCREFALDQNNFSLRDPVDNWPNGIGKHAIICEDFDTYFNKRKKLEKEARINFSELLNAIQGQNAVHGRVLFFTTNKLEAVDEALGYPLDPDAEVCYTTRPGRLDVALKFTYVTDEQRAAIAKRILDAGDPLPKASPTDTSVLWIEKCVAVVRARTFEALK